MKRKRTSVPERRFSLSGIVHLVVGCVLMAVCIAIILPALGATGGDPLAAAIVSLMAGGLGWAYIRSHGRVREIRLTDAGIELHPAGTVIRWEHVTKVALPGLGLAGQQRRMAPRALRFTLTDRSFRWEPGRWMQFAGTGRIHLVGGDTRQIVAAIMERMAERS
jgi:hypothetical protein